MTLPSPELIDLFDFLSGGVKRVVGDDYTTITTPKTYCWKLREGLIPLFENSYKYMEERFAIEYNLWLDTIKINDTLYHVLLPIPQGISPSTKKRCMQDVKCNEL
jgi:hypothetical protein